MRGRRRRRCPRRPTCRAGWRSSPSESWSPKSRSSVRTCASSGTSSVRVSRRRSEQDGGGDDHEDHAGQADDAPGPRTARCAALAVAEPPEVDEHRVEHVHRRRAEARRTRRTAETRAAPATSTTAPPTRNDGQRPAQAARHPTRAELRARPARRPRWRRQSARARSGSSATSWPSTMSIDPADLREHQPPDEQDPPGGAQPAPQRDSHHRAAGRRRPGWARSGWSAATRRSSDVRK